MGVTLEANSRDSVSTKRACTSSPTRKDPGNLCVTARAGPKFHLAGVDLIDQPVIATGAGRDTPAPWSPRRISCTARHTVPPPLIGSNKEIIVNPKWLTQNELFELSLQQVY